MPISQFVTAKEISSVVEMTERNVRYPRVQQRLGIAGFRDRLCQKPIRWHRAPVRQHLCAQGYSSARAL